MMELDFSQIDLEEGFLPRFSREFLDHYGEDSSFVRALSDCFTLALARAVQRSNPDSSGQSPSILGTRSGLEAVSEIINAFEGSTETALREAMGAAPVGSLALLVDSNLGLGRFEEWRRHLEAGEYRRASSVLTSV